MAAEPETCYRHPKEETRVHCTRCNRPICPECMNPAPVGHHCPQCVAEARRSVRRPRRLRAPSSLAMVILGINVAVFVVEIALGATTNIFVLVDMGALVPGLVADGQYWRLITPIFLHASVFHILFNSWALYIFGSLVEGTFGTIRFAAIYLITGFAASVASMVAGNPAIAAVGASGAIFGLLGAWLAYNLRRRQLTLAQANIRLALILVALNLVFGFSVRGIDNSAHIGGLIAGVIAGVAAEGFGRRGVRVAVQVVGLAALFAVAVVVATVRVSSLRA